MSGTTHRKYPVDSFRDGDMVLTGTPGGGAFSSPRWMVHLANLIGMNRIAKLKAAFRNAKPESFLIDSDKVEVRGEGLGTVTVYIGREH